MKDENKARRFMAQQQQLATKIAEVLKIETIQILYFEIFPSGVSRDKDTGEIRLLNSHKRNLPNSIIVEGEKNSKQRIEVRIFAKGIYEKIGIKECRQKLNKLMHRNYEVRGNLIIYKVKPFH